MDYHDEIDYEPQEPTEGRIGTIISWVLGLGALICFLAASTIFWYTVLLPYILGIQR